MLKEQLEKGREELDYINSVLDTVDRAENEKTLHKFVRNLPSRAISRFKRAKAPSDNFAAARI